MPYTYGKQGGGNSVCMKGLGQRTTVRRERTYGPKEDNRVRINSEAA